MIEGFETANDALPAAGSFTANQQPRSTVGLDRAKARNRLGFPAPTLLVALALAIGLMLVPARWSDVIKGQAAAFLRPGQMGVLRLREHSGWIVAQAKRYVKTASKLAEAERERERLVEANRRLVAELALARSQLSDAKHRGDDDSLPRLLAARWVKARVLGQLGRAFLGWHRLLDVGSASGVQPDALVVDAPPGLIDQGRDAHLKAGQLVLSRGRVWGKVVQVGRHTSVVRTVTEPGYRDLVRLGDAGPQGILEGTGEPLARIRLVEVTEPVALGDPVYSAAGKGMLAEPPCYGRIVRLERPRGAAHWEIWIEPHVDPRRTDEVAVLCVQLNPLRVGAAD